MKSNAFPARMRLTRNLDIRAVMDGGSSSADDRYVVYVLENGLDHPRLVLLVGRKHGKANRRNRIKRRIREAFRLSASRLPAGFDLAVIPRVRPEIPTLPEAEECLVVLSHRAKRRRRKKRDARPDRAD